MFWQGILGLQATVRPDGLIGLAPLGGDRPLLLLEIDPRAPESPPSASGLVGWAVRFPGGAEEGPVRGDELTLADPDEVLVRVWSAVG